MSVFPPAPSPFDKTLAPPGRHIMSMFTQWVPESWSREPHRAGLEAYADYRSPIRGLYQASSATRAGGGVNGLPGHHVVREMLRDGVL